MRIVTLVENTCTKDGCEAAHGLSFYIETEKHRLLMDAGPSDLLLKNASALGVDLRTVDTAILSHGHYDHGGGLPAFASLNPDAKIYIHDGAFEEFCSAHEGEGIHSIGIDGSLKQFPGLILTGDRLAIDDELSLFGGIAGKRLIPSGNSELKIRRSGELFPDDFSHEMCLVISEGSKKVLLSGCAHHGILNILDRYRDLYGCDPDAVISGFHLMRRFRAVPGKTAEICSDEDIRLISDTALELKEMETQFYTCHCTGIEPFRIMKDIMGGKLEYLHTGDEVLFHGSISSVPAP